MTKQLFKQLTIQTKIAYQKYRIDMIERVHIPHCKATYDRQDLLQLAIEFWEERISIRKQEIAELETDLQTHLAIS